MKDLHGFLPHPITLKRNINENRRFSTPSNIPNTKNGLFYTPSP
jgi:hypothetical protein